MFLISFSGVINFHFLFSGQEIDGSGTAGFQAEIASHPSVLTGPSAAELTAETAPDGLFPDGLSRTEKGDTLQSQDSDESENELEEVPQLPEIPLQDLLDDLKCGSDQSGITSSIPVQHDAFPLYVSDSDSADSDNVPPLDDLKTSCETSGIVSSIAESDTGPNSKLQRMVNSDPLPGGSPIRTQFDNDLDISETDGLLHSYGAKPDLISDWTPKQPDSQQPLLPEDQFDGGNNGNLPSGNLFSVDNKHHKPIEINNDAIGNESETDISGVDPDDHHIEYKPNEKPDNKYDMQSVPVDNNDVAESKHMIDQSGTVCKDENQNGASVLNPDDSAHHVEQFMDVHENNKNIQQYHSDSDSSIELNFTLQTAKHPTNEKELVLGVVVDHDDCDADSPSSGADKWRVREATPTPGHVEEPTPGEVHKEEAISSIQYKDRDDSQDALITKDTHSTGAGSVGFANHGSLADCSEVIPLHRQRCINCCCPTLCCKKRAFIPWLVLWILCIVSCLVVLIVDGVYSIYHGYTFSR